MARCAIDSTASARSPRSSQHRWPGRSMSKACNASSAASAALVMTSASAAAIMTRALDASPTVIAIFACAAASAGSAPEARKCSA